MKLQKRRSRIAGPRRDFARTRPLGDAEQEADQQRTPQQSTELFGKLGRAAVEQSGRLSSSHYLTQSATSRLPPDRVERLRYFGGEDCFGNRQSKYRNDGWFGFFAVVVCPIGGQEVREGRGMGRPRPDRGLL